MTTPLLQQALEALERLDGWLNVRHLGGLMPEEKALATAIRAHLEEPKGEEAPTGFAWVTINGQRMLARTDAAANPTIAYTASPPAPQAERVALTPLTEEQIKSLLASAGGDLEENERVNFVLLEFIRLLFVKFCEVNGSGTSAKKEQP